MAVGAGNSTVGGSPQHIPSVRKSLAPSVHFSKDTPTGHQVEHIIQRFMNNRKVGEKHRKEPYRCLKSAGLTSGVLAARLAVQLLWSFKLNYLGFDYCSESPDKGGTSWMRAEELPATSCHFQGFLTPLSSSRALCRHKDLEKFPGKAVLIRHTFSWSAFTAWLSDFGRTPQAHLVG